MKTTSASIAVRNLCAPTLPCYPPAQDRFHWRVLSHLGSSFLSLMDNAEVLRGTLALYEWTDSEMNRRRLEAILDVKHRATERFAQGHLVPAVQIEVTLDSHGFAGRGDICLFGEMLSRFFALYTDIYLFNRLIIILQPTGERLEWEEKHSRRIPRLTPRLEADLPRINFYRFCQLPGKTASRPTADGGNQPSG
ncbi:protein ImpG/VasA [Klebsiella pneumoniae]|nr:protein ImpG/VasA [Klebsiella pneumoniae]